MATRYENKLLIKDDKGRVVAEVNKYNTTPEQVLNEVKSMFQKGEIIQSRGLFKLKQKGYQTNTGKIEPFILGNIDMQIVFRKG